MTPLGLTLEVNPSSGAALHAASLLMSDSRLKARLRFVRAPRELPSRGVLRIEPASILRPLLTLLSGDRGAAPARGEDAHRRLALSPAIFTSGPAGDAWQHSARPLPARARYGSPDLERPWVLVAPGLRADRALIERTTGLRNAQAHFIGPRSAGDHPDPVWWLPGSSVLHSLLGHVDAVLAPVGPLFWDAQRVGVPVFDPGSGGGVPAPLAVARLEHVVPSTLVRDGDFWRALASELVQGRADSAWGTLPWLLRAREQPAFSKPASGLLNGFRVKQKLLKLRRDPAKFWADSALVRRVMRDRASRSA